MDNGSDSKVFKNRNISKPTTKRRVGGVVLSKGQYLTLMKRKGKVQRKTSQTARVTSKYFARYKSFTAAKPKNISRKLIFETEKKENMKRGFLKKKKRITKNSGVNSESKHARSEVIGVNKKIKKSRVGMPDVFKRLSSRVPKSLQMKKLAVRKKQVNIKKKTFIAFGKRFTKFEPGRKRIARKKVRRVNVFKEGEDDKPKEIEIKKVVKVKNTTPRVFEEDNLLKPNINTVNQPQKKFTFSNLTLRDSKNKVEEYPCFWDRDLFKKEFISKIVEQSCDNDVDTEDEHIMIATKSMFNNMINFLY